jgi:hypothetical protein
MSRAEWNWSTGTPKGQTVHEKTDEQPRPLLYDAAGIALAPPPKKIGFQPVEKPKADEGKPA